MFRAVRRIRARTIEEFFDVGYAASRCGLPKSNRIGIVTVSGGVGVLMADDAIENGLDVCGDARLTRKRASKRWCRSRAPRNPLDTTGQVSSDITLLDQSVEIMLAQASMICSLRFNRRPDCRRSSGRIWQPSQGRCARATRMSQ